MSPQSPAPPTPNDLTRQQLDELDALLQRMLALPVPTPPAAVAPLTPPPVPVPPPPAPTISSSWRFDPPEMPRPPFVTEEIPDREPEPAVALARPEPLFLPVAAPAAEVAESFAPRPATFTTPTIAVEPEPPLVTTTGTLRGVDAPALPANFRTAFADPEPSEPEPEPIALTVPEPVPEPPAEPRDRVPVLFWPLFAANWVLETLLGLCGPVGAAVTSPVSKHVLGAAGVLLLVAAGAWSARGLGWVRFPLPR